MDSKVKIVKDIDGSSIVVINDIRFKGKRKIDWKDVEEYLKELVGKCYVIAESADKVIKRCMGKSESQFCSRTFGNNSGCNK